MEWTTVTVLVVLAGLFATIGAPIIKLVITLTRLNVLLDALYKEHNENVCKNQEAHNKLVAQNDEQEKHLDNHEFRIAATEQKVETIGQKVDTIFQSQYNEVK